MILKPLYGNGGAGVFHLKPDDRNMTSLLEMFAQMYREPFIAQEYLSDVRRRQAHHPDRRRAGRRDQPGAGRA
jgi:glutathione synthase/RimK-type ligase-like ATP-grasp enzyme